MSSQYTVEQYNKLLEELFDNIRALAKNKGGEYTHGDDRLDNFRRHGNDLNVSMELVWRIYAGKHWDAITTYINDLKDNKDRYRSESITGRAIDLIVYLTLFIAMVEERKEGSQAASASATGFKTNEYPY